MTIAWAFVVIAALDLIDRNNAWKTAARITARVVAAAALGFGAYFGYQWCRFQFQQRADYLYANQHIQMKQVTIEKFKNTDFKNHQQVCDDRVYQLLTIGEKQEVFYELWWSKHQPNFKEITSLHPQAANGSANISKHLDNPKEADDDFPKSLEDRDGLSQHLSKLGERHASPQDEDGASQLYIRTNEGLPSAPGVVPARLPGSLYDNPCGSELK